MRLDIDLDTDTLTYPGAKDLITLLSFKLATTPTIDVRFWRSGMIVELAAGATGKFGIKPAGQYDAAPLVLAESWTKTGTGTATVYTFTPSFNTETLADILLSGDGISNNDVATLPAMTEIRWVESGAIHRTQSVLTNILNSILKDEDGTPLALPSPEQWLDEMRPDNFWIFMGFPPMSFGPPVALEVSPSGTENCLKWPDSMYGPYGAFVPGPAPGNASSLTLTDGQVSWLDFRGVTCPTVTLDGSFAGSFSGVPIMIGPHLKTLVVTGWEMSSQTHLLPWEDMGSIETLILSYVRPGEGVTISEKLALIPAHDTFQALTLSRCGNTIDIPANLGSLSQLELVTEANLGIVTFATGSLPNLKYCGASGLMEGSVDALAVEMLAAAVAGNLTGGVAYFAFSAAPSAAGAAALAALNTTHGYSIVHN